MAQLILQTLVLAVFLINSPARAAVSLTEAYQAAQKKSETLGIKIEDVTQAEEHLNQAEGAILPTIAGVATYLQQETPKTGTAAATATSTSPANSQQTTTRITATQPLFRGLREYAALRLERRTLENRRALEAQARADLYVDVAQAYYLILFLEKNIKDLSGQTDLIDTRLKELRQRIKIGRSRLSEALSVEVTQASTQSQLLTLRSQLKAARDSFQLVTGLSKMSQLEDPGDLNPHLKPIETYLKNAGERPDVKAAELGVAAGEENINIAKGAHLPSIDLTGNYYLQRPAFQTGVDWDLGVVLTLPIFEGGVTQSHVREAASQLRQADLQLNLLRQQVDALVRQLFEDLNSSIQQVAVLDKGNQAAERNYREELREYRLGLTNNLDVNTAQANYIVTSSSLEQARYNTRVLWSKLQSATGETLR